MQLELPLVAAPIPGYVAHENSRAVLINDFRTEIIGIIARPTREHHSAAELWSTVDCVIESMNLPVGRYRLLHIVEFDDGTFLYRRRLSAFDVVENP